MRMVVLGARGQVARSLLERGDTHGCTVTAVGRPTIDLDDEVSIARAFSGLAADIVVNAAAYTAVDRAESEPERALAVNARAAGQVAREAHARNLPLIHLSTDYVFDGAATRPYKEDDTVAPLNVYGRSKLEGERAVAAAQPDHAILRASWIFSPFGHNFVRTMLRLAQTKEEIAVVADQRGAPTNALDLADGIFAVGRNLLARRNAPELRGLFHMAPHRATNWAGFAEAIFQSSRRLGGPVAVVRPISTAEYPTAARRPSYSCLDARKAKERHGVSLPGFRSSLDGCVARLLQDLEMSG